MKPSVKIGSLLLAVMMVFTALFAAGCTPISLNKEWSYKTSDKELAIGAYIYSLNTAYQKAQTYASEQLDDYDESSDAWLDKEIKDDDGTTQVAREWIKDQAKLMCLTYLVIDEQLVKENAEVDEATLASADEQAETYWNVGPYADYGYAMPMSDELEKYGVSFDSFKYCTSEYSVKNQALFDAIYNEGGSKAVADSELEEFFNESYVNYSYFSVNLYSASTDEAGESVNVALSDEDAKKLTDEIDGYAKDINGGKSFDDTVEKYMEANEVTTDPSVTNTEELENCSMGDEFKEALTELKNNKATTIQVGSGESAIYYLIYKSDIKDTTKDYLSEEANHSSVLSAMKSEEYDDYIKGLTEKLEYEENTSVINKYEPKMFFVKPEETTVASDEESATE